MNFKFSVSIVLSRPALIFKAMLYGAVVFAVLVAIGSGILIPTLRPLYAELSAVFSSIEQGFYDFTSGSATLDKMLLGFREALFDMPAIIGRHGGKLIASYFVVVALIFISGFLKGTFDLALASNIDDYMSSKMKSGFSSKYFSHIAVSLRYAPLRAAIDAVAYALIFLIMYCFVRYTVGFFGFFSITVAAVLGIALLSFKFAVFSEWLPRILKGEKVVSSLKSSVMSIKSPGFGKKFFGAACHYTVFVICIFAFTVPTFGFILIAVLPLGVCLLRTMELVGFYGSEGRKFYIDDYNICG